MPEAPSSQLLAPHYLTQFQCIGPDCEETCCIGWQIQVDQAHFVALEKVMSRSAEERELFRHAYVPVPEAERTRDVHAKIQLQPGRACIFLDEERLCTIQRNYGEELLSNVCATYPRLVVRANDRLEVSGKMSCPEMARRCLLDPRAMELVDLDPAKLQRTQPQARQPALFDFYVHYFDDVRVALLRILNQDQHPLDARLFALARFAEQCAPFFFRGTQRFEERLLVGVIDETHIVPFARRDGAVSSAVMRLVLQLLFDRSASPTTSSSLRHLVNDVFCACGVESAGETEAVRMGELFERRRRWWEAEHAARIDGYFSNYARNYWLTNWYTTSPTLAAHLLKLLVRQAALRLLLFCHPALAPPTERDIAIEQKTLDAVVVEVVYKFTRAFEHFEEFLKQLNQSIETWDAAKLIPELLHF